MKRKFAWILLFSLVFTQVVIPGSVHHFRHPVEFLNSTEYEEIAAPATPVAGRIKFWYDSTTNKLTSKDENGTVVEYGPEASQVVDSTFRVTDNLDATKKLAFEVTGITTGNVRTWTVPDADGTFAGIALTQTLTNKTLTSPVINGANLEYGTASNTNRLVLAKDTTTNLDLLTDIQGLAAWDTTLNSFVVNDGTGWSQVGGVVTAGDGIDIISDVVSTDLQAAGAGTGGLEIASGELTLDFTTTPGLEKTATGVQVLVDTTSTGTTASVLSLGAAGVGVRVDNSSIEGSAAAGSLRVKDAGIGSNHMFSGAFGNGLTGGSGPQVTVDLEANAAGAGGLGFDAGQVRVDLKDTSPGLELTTTGLAALVDTTKGIAITSSGIRVSAAADKGMTFDGGTGELIPNLAGNAGAIVISDGAPLGVTNGDIVWFPWSIGGLKLTTSGAAISLDTTGGANLATVVNISGITDRGVSIRVDDTTIEDDGNGATAQLRVKALGIDTAQLAADAVDGTKIGDDVINSEHYAAGSIDNEHLSIDSVTQDEIRLDNASFLNARNFGNTADINILNVDASDNIVFASTPRDNDATAPTADAELSNKKYVDDQVATAEPLLTNSAGLAAALSDETGTGLAVFSTSPVLRTPQIDDTSNDHQYIFAVSELTLDRTVTMPLLTGNDTFVFEAHTATLTNKTISADNNTLSGIAASSFVVSDGSGNIDGAAAQKAIPTGDVVGTSDTQTLDNKTLEGAEVNNSNLLSPSIWDTSADQKYIIGVSELATTDKTITLPLLTGNDTFVFESHTQTLDNKTLEGAEVNNSNLLSASIWDTSADQKYIIGVSELATTDKTITLPLLTGNDTFVFESHTQTLDNKTLEGAEVNNSNLLSASIWDTSADQKYIIGVSELATTDKTITLPLLSGNDTFVFEGHTATLTNKTISADDNTLSGIAATSFVLSDGSGNIDGAAAQKVIPSGVVVGDTDTQTLTNKTLTLPQINDTTGDQQYVFAVSELTTTDKTVTLPLLTGNDTFVFEGHTQTLTNKTLTSPVLNTGVSGTAVLDEDNMISDSNTQLATQQSIKAYVDTQIGNNTDFSDDVFRIEGNVDATKLLAFEVDGFTTLTTRTLTPPDANGTLVLEAHAQTLTNKTISADNNTLSGIAASSFVVSDGSGNIDGAAAQKVIPSGVVVGTTDTQTLSNKTLTGPVLDLPEINDTSDDHQYIFAVSELTLDRTITLPLLGGNDTFVFEAHTQTLTNKTIDADNNTVSNIDDGEIKAGAAIDATKIADGTVTSAEFQYINTLSSNAQTQIDGKEGTLTNSAGLAAALSDETGTGLSVFATSPVLTTPQINDTTGDQKYIFAVSELTTTDKTITLPLLTASDTFVFEAHTQTLSNKTLTTPTIASFTNATHDHTNAAGGGQLDHGTALTGLGDDDHPQYEDELDNSTGLAAALSDETGTGLAVFNANPDINGADLVFGTASNTNRLVLANDTTTNLDLLTDTQGLLAYDDTLDAPVFNDGTGWKTMGEALSAGDGIDIISNTISTDLEAAGVGTGGLSIDAGEVRVTAGDGIELTAGGVAVDIEAAGTGTGGLAFDAGELRLLIDTTDGLDLSAAGLGVNIDTTEGLEFNTGQLRFKPGGLASGLVATSGTYPATGVPNGAIHVVTNGSGGLELDTSGVQIKLDATGGANLATVVNTAANGTSIRVDDSTIEDDGGGASGQLRVKADGIDSQHYAAGSIDNEHLSIDSVTQDEIRLDNASFLNARNFANNADINILNVDASDNIVFASTPRDNDTTAPTADAELSNKKYVDDQVATAEPLLTNSAGLAAALSDETGTGLAVFATSPVLTTPQINDTTGDQKYIFAVSELATTDKTITLPLLTASDTFVFESHTQTLTNKTISADNNTLSGIAATSFVLSDGSGNIDGAAAQKVIPSGAVVGDTDTQTLTNKTLTLPQINDTTGDQQYIFAVSELVTTDKTITLPLLTGNDTFVFEAHTQTLTNKTINADNNTVSNIDDGEIKAGAAIDATKIADGTVTSAEFQYIGGLTSDAQTQINSKEGTLTNSAGLAAALSDETGTGVAVFNEAPQINDAVLFNPQIDDVSQDHQYLVVPSELTLDRNITLPLLTGNDTFVFESHTQSLSNKTLEMPQINDATLFNPLIDDFSQDHQYVVVPSELTLNRNVTLPLLTGDDTFVFESHTQTLSNKTLEAPQINDAVLFNPLIDDTSQDHQYVFVPSELTLNRNVTLPLLTGDDTFVFESHTQTLSNKTLEAPQINDANLFNPLIDDSAQDNVYSVIPSDLSANRNITLPLLTGNDTFVFEGHTQTLTNKTLTTPVVNGMTSGVRTEAGNYTVLSTDDTILVDALADNRTITLPASISGKTYNIIRIDNAKTTVSDPFTDGSITVGTDNIAETAHGFQDTQKVQLTTTGTLPTGLAAATNYWVILVDANNYKLASSEANAIADTAVDITAASGGGTHTTTSQTTTVTIDGNASETIDSLATFELLDQHDSVSMVGDSSNWQSIAKPNALHLDDNGQLLMPDDAIGGTIEYSFSTNSNTGMSTADSGTSLNLYANSTQAFQAKSAGNTSFVNFHVRTDGSAANPALDIGGGASVTTGLYQADGANDDSLGISANGAASMVLDGEAGARVITAYDRVHIDENGGSANPALRIGDNAAMNTGFYSYDTTNDDGLSISCDGTECARFDGGADDIHFLYAVKLGESLEWNQAASNTDFLKLPSNTTTNLDLLTDVAGHLAYDTTTNELKYNNGSGWVAPGGGGNDFVDNVFRIQDDGDNTKEIAFQASGITTGTTRTLTVEDKDGTIVTYDGSSQITLPQNTTAIISDQDADSGYGWNASGTSLLLVTNGTTKFQVSTSTNTSQQRIINDVDGTAAAPALTIGEHPAANTGLYTADTTNSDTLDVSANGTQAFQFDGANSTNESKFLFVIDAGANMNFGTASNTNRIVLPTDTTTNLDALTDTAGLLAYDTTLNEIVYNNGSGWQQTGGGGLSNIVEDTTPQLGGNLDVQSSVINTSTVNGGITLTPNGTGNVTLGTMVFDSDQTIGAGQDNYVLTYDNGTGLISLEAASGGSHPDPHQLADGAVGAPAYSFSSDTDLGMWRDSTDASINFSVDGVEVFELDNGEATLSTEIVAPYGSNVDPTYKFGDADSGMWGASNGQINITSNASHVLDIHSDRVKWAKQVQFIDGSVSAPGISFRDDADTGFYRATNNIHLSINNSTYYSFSSSDFTAVNPIIPNGGISFGTASNSINLQLPDATTSALEALTDVETMLAYDTDRNQPVFHDGSWFQHIIPSNMNAFDRQGFEAAQTTSGCSFTGTDCTISYTTSTSEAMGLETNKRALKISTVSASGTYTDDITPAGAAAFAAGQPVKIGAWIKTSATDVHLCSYINNSEGNCIQVQTDDTYRYYEVRDTIVAASQDIGYRIKFDTSITDVILVDEVEFGLIKEAPKSQEDGLRRKGELRATYDFAEHGGAISTIGLGVFIPDNTIITRCYYDVITTFTSATDAATVAINVPTDGDLQAATAISAGGNIWDAGIHETATKGNDYSDPTTYLKTTGTRELSVVIATEAVTAGKMIIFCDYNLSE
jgi:hypothetical protein